MKNTMSKWLSMLLAVCMLLSAPMALMEEALEAVPEAPVEEIAAPVEEIEAPVEEVALELGVEEEQTVELTDESVVELESEALEAEMAQGRTYNMFLYEEEYYDLRELIRLADDETIVKVESSNTNRIIVEWDDEEPDYAVFIPVNSGSCEVKIRTSKDITHTINFFVPSYEGGGERTGDTTASMTVELFEKADFYPYDVFAIENPEEEQINSFQVKNQSNVTGKFYGDFALIEAKRVGESTLIFKSTKGRTFEVAVKIVDTYAPKSIVLNEGKALTLSGGEDYNIPYALQPEDARDMITWTSSDHSVVAIGDGEESGYIVANRAGTAVITATAYNGVKGTLNVTVTSNAADLPAGVLINARNFPNEIFRNYVASHFDGDRNGVLDEGEIAEITEISLTGEDIHEILDMDSVKGIEFFPNLEVLVVCYCNLTSLDLSKNPNLNYLDILGNEKLTTVDISKCPRLVAVSKNEPEEDEELGYEYYLYTGGAILLVGKNVRVNNSETPVTKDPIVTLSPRGEKTVNLSEKTLTVTATVENTNTQPKWTTSNSKVATVSNGVVTLKGAGTADITATAAGASDTLTLTVVDDTVPESVEIEYNGEDTVGINKTLNLKAIVEPDTADKTVTWKSSDTKVATVDKNGVVETKKHGSVVITATAKGGISAELELEVVDDSIPEYVEIVYDGDTTVGVKQDLPLTVSVSPETADGAVKWTSSDTKVATVDKNGVVKTKKDGKVTITATAAKGDASDALDLTVVDNTVPKDVEIVYEGDNVVNISEKTIQLKAVVEPSTAAQDVVWKVTPSNVAKIDKNGVLTLKKHGEITVTVAVKKNKNITSELELAIEDDTVPQEIDIVPEGDADNFFKGQTLTLKAEIYPATAAGAKITWKATPSSVASIKNGVLTAKKKGTVTVTASVKGVDVEGEIKIDVKDNSIPEEIVINHVNVDKGDSVTLTAQVLPASAVQTVKWKLVEANPKGCATLNSKGVLKTKKAGTVKITATSSKDKTVAGEITIEIKDRKAPADVVIDQGESVTIKVKEKKTLTATLTPSFDNVKPESVLTWTSSDKKIATVNKKTGQVAGKKAGTAVITVTTDNGKTDTITVNVQ